MYYRIEPRNGRLRTNIWGNDWYLFPVGNNEYVSSSDTSFQNIDPKNRYYFETVNKVPGIIIPLRIINDKLAIIFGYGRFSGQALQFVSGKDQNEVMKFMGYHCVRK